MAGEANNGQHTVLCRLEDLLDPDSRAFDVMWRGEMVEMFLVRKHEQVFGYLNRCPHTGGPLDWSPNEFLDVDRHHIQCATHDALFSIEDGLCLAGPCTGDRLTPLPILVKDGLVSVDNRILPR